MALLPPSAIVAMRATLNRTFADSALIQRRTIENVGGEIVGAWDDLATVACRITFIGGGEAGEVGGKIAEESTHLVTMAADTDVEEPDRVVIDGVTYDVLLVRKRGAWELSRRVEVKEAV